MPRRHLRKIRGFDLMPGMSLAMHTAQMWWGAADVIQKRVGRLAVAPLPLQPRDQREIVRMGAEKIAAMNEAALAAYDAERRQAADPGQRQRPGAQGAQALPHPGKGKRKAAVEKELRTTIGRSRRLATAEGLTRRDRDNRRGRQDPRAHPAGRLADRDIAPTVAVEPRSDRRTGRTGRHRWSAPEG